MPKIQTGFTSKLMASNSRIFTITVFFISGNKLNTNSLVAENLIYFTLKNKYSLNIAVNTRLLLPNRLEGIGWFTYESFSRIVKQHPEHTFYFLFDRPFDEKFVFADNVVPIVLRPPARHPILFVIWFEWSVKQFLRKHCIDLFVSPDGYLSLGSDVPSLAVIHDLNFEHHPKDLPWTPRKYYSFFFPKFAKKARRIATVSEYSKHDIAATYQINPSKIDVVYNGVNPDFKPIPVEEQDAVRASYTGAHPYFLYVGALHPRKNIKRLLLAFDQVASAHQNIHLLLVGEAMWSDKDLKNTYRQLSNSDRVKFTGRLSSVRLQQVFASAFALCYVPYFEGFGIPIIEAMKSGIPVMAANKTSLPEVSGDAALLVDPFDLSDIARGMTELLSDQKLCQSLRKKGMERAQRFTWENTASLLWESMMKTLTT